MKNQRKLLIVLILMLLTLGAASAATPPDRMHYQGVLRDSSDVPLDGAHDLVFRFWSGETAGSEILIDRHTTSTGFPVDVDEGLFQVELGGGLVEDGSGGGTYTDLPSVFRAYGSVWIEIEVDGEVMSPRGRVYATAYAMNAGSLDGIEGAGFLRSDASDTFSGTTLTIGPSSDLNVDGELRLSGTLEMKDGGGDGDQRINFFDGGVAANEYVMWDDSADRFHVSDDLYVERTIRTNSYLSVEGNLFFNENGGEGGRALYFYNNGSSTGEHIRWDNTYDRFRISDDLDVDGNLRIGDQIRINADGPDGHQSIFFYNDGSDSGEYIGWGDADDRFNVSTDIRVNGHLEAETSLHLRAGPGESPYILFWDTPTAGWESLSWDETGGEFRFTDNLYVMGTVGVGLNADEAVKDYNHFGSGAASPQSPEISSSLDVFIEGDLELGGSLLPGTVKGKNGGSLNLEANINVRTMFDADNSTTSNRATWHHDGSYVNSTQVMELQEDGDLRIRGALSQNVAFDLAESFLAGEPLEAGELVRLDPAVPGGVRRSTGTGDNLVLGVVSSRPGVLLGSAPFDVQALRTTWGDQVADRFGEELPALREQVLESAPDLRSALQELENMPEGESADELEIAATRAELEDRIVSLCLERFHEKTFVPVALAGRVPVRIDPGHGAVRPGDLLGPGPVPGTAMVHDGTGPVIGTALEGSGGGKRAVLAFVHRGGKASAPANAEAGTEARAPAPESAPEGDGIDTPPVRFGELLQVEDNGDVRTPGSFRPEAREVAEFFPVSEPVEPGDVLVLDRQSPGSCRRGDMAEDPAVIGVVSGDPGLLLGGDGEAGQRDGRVPVGLGGIIPCKVDASYGAVYPGDLLVSSPTPGHAMRIDSPLPGTVVGKAMESLESGTGVVRILIVHQ